MKVRKAGKKPGELHRLTDMDIAEVSEVPRAANAEVFIIIKGVEDEPLVLTDAGRATLDKSLVYGEGVDKGQSWQGLPLMPLWELPDLAVPGPDVLKALKSHPVVIHNLQAVCGMAAGFLSELAGALDGVTKDDGIIPETVVFPAELSAGLDTVARAFGVILGIHKGGEAGTEAGVPARKGAGSEHPDNRANDMAGVAAMLRTVVAKAVESSGEKREAEDQNGRRVERAAKVVVLLTKACGTLEGDCRQLAADLAQAKRELRVLKGATPDSASADPDDGFSLPDDAGGGFAAVWPRDMNDAEDDDGE